MTCFLGSLGSKDILLRKRRQRLKQKQRRGHRDVSMDGETEEDLLLGYEQRPKEMKKEEKGLSSTLLHTSSHLSNYQLQIGPSCFPKDLI